MESAACGLLAARSIWARLTGRDWGNRRPKPPCAARCLATSPTPNKDFQPMGANMGILPARPDIRDKRARYRRFVRGPRRRR